LNPGEKHVTPRKGLEGREGGWEVLKAPPNPAQRTFGGSKTMAVKNSSVWGTRYKEMGGEKMGKGWHREKSTQAARKTERRFQQQGTNSSRKQKKILVAERPRKKGEKKKKRGYRQKRVDSHPPRAQPQPGGACPGKRGETTVERIGRGRKKKPSDLPEQERARPIAGPWRKGKCLRLAGTPVKNGWGPTHYTFLVPWKAESQ